MHIRQNISNFCKKGSRRDGRQEEVQERAVQRIWITSPDHLSRASQSPYLYLSDTLHLVFTRNYSILQIVNVRTLFRLGSRSLLRGKPLSSLPHEPPPGERTTGHSPGRSVVNLIGRPTPPSPGRKEKATFGLTPPTVDQKLCISWVLHPTEPLLSCRSPLMFHSENLRIKSEKTDELLIPQIANNPFIFLSNIPHEPWTLDQSSCCSLSPS